MNYDIIAKIILAASVCGLVTAIVHCMVKVVLFIGKIIAHEPVRVNFTPQIWTIGTSTLLIATYFIFL